jgi:hypothetical protein
VPHYDNSEGGNHDTRYCYMGERRLAVLEAELPDDTGIVGVDEHTAAIFDLGVGTLSVRGRGVVTVRRRGHSEVIPAGSEVALAELQEMLAGRAAARSPVAPTSRVDDDRPLETVAATSLWETVTSCEKSFEQGAAGGDATAMATAILDLDRAIVAWSADTLQSDEVDRAHAVLRSLVVRLGDAAAAGVRDPRGRLAPLVDPLIALREEQRAARGFAVADAVRDALSAGGIELRDGPDGTDWVVTGS